METAGKLSASYVVIGVKEKIGYGFGDLVAPTGTFVDFPEGAKWVLILTMILGRLSLLALLVVVMPQFWRR